MEESTLGSYHSLVGETKGEKYVVAESYQLSATTLSAMSLFHQLQRMRVTVRIVKDAFDKTKRQRWKSD